jgi:hypothetical protein
MLGNQVLPLRIGSAHQFILPDPFPALELLFTGNGIRRILIFLDINQAMHPVLLHELAALAAAMLDDRRPTSFVTPIYIALSELLVMM